VKILQRATDSFSWLFISQHRILSWPPASCITVV